MNEHKGLYGVPSLFPTPPHICDLMIERAGIRPTDKIMEPSAGTGALARVIRERHPENPLYVIEKDSLLRAGLILDGFHTVGWDFLIWNYPVDVIIQNPPFSNNYQDADHIYHAWSVLKPGGRLVSLAHKYTGFSPSSNPRYKPTGFGAWMKDVGLDVEMLPEHSFATAEQPSNVEVCIICGTK